MNTWSESLHTALGLVLSGDAALWAIVGRSLAVSTTATAIGCAVGLWLGAWLGVSRFAGRGAVLTVLNTLLALPSVVVGLVIYLLLSRSGPLGSLGWLFSFQAMVLAQVVLVVPVVTALTRQALDRAILERETEAAPGAGQAEAQAAAPNSMAGKQRNAAFSVAPGPTPRGVAVRSSRLDRGS